MVIKNTEAGAAKTQTDRSDKIEHLDQGWTDANRKLFYETTQGSKLVPYSWYINLEQASNQKPFNAADHMDGLGYIFARPSKDNNEQLPIGFVIDDGKSASPGTMTSNETYRIPRLTDVGKSIPGEPWLGLTCAACHTAQIEHNGHKFQVDGAPSMTDNSAFTKELRDAFRATLDDEAKFKRFAGKLMDHPTAEQEAKLRNDVSQYAEALNLYVETNEPPSPYGHGRLDALGALANSIVGTDMNEKINYRTADAPVRFPSLWGTPNFDWVQWNGSVYSPLARNAGEVAGVFAELDLKAGSPTMLRSSIELRNLYTLEQDLKKLKAPKWPEEFGKLDEKAVKRGELIFKYENCGSCHNVPAKTYLTPFLRRLEQTNLIPLREIGTDPTSSTNFAERTAKTGAFKDKMGGKDEMPLPLLIVPAIESVIKEEFKHEGVTFPFTMLQMNDFRQNLLRTDVEQLKGIKAPNLEGVWARAPYLHNGSVPTLHDLFQPGNQRPKEFHVGSRQFNPEKVGFETEKGPSLVDTTLKGNSNRGHEGEGFGTTLTKKQVDDLIEYLKSL